MQLSCAFCLRGSNEGSRRLIEIGFVLLSFDIAMSILCELLVSGDSSPLDEYVGSYTSVNTLNLRAFHINNAGCFGQAELSSVLQLRVVRLTLDPENFLGSSWTLSFALIKLQCIC